MRIEDLIEEEWYVDDYMLFKYIGRSVVFNNLIFFNEYFTMHNPAYHNSVKSGKFEILTMPATNEDLIKLPPYHPMHLKAKWELTYTEKTVENLLLLYNTIIKL